MLRRIGLVVLVAFVVFLVLGWAHAAGALGHVHDHGGAHHQHGGDFGGDFGADEPCRICDALFLWAGAALFVALLMLLAVLRASPGAAPARAAVTRFAPHRFAAPRGPPIA